MEPSFEFHLQCVVRKQSSAKGPHCSSQPSIFSKMLFISQQHVHSSFSFPSLDSTDVISRAIKTEPMGEISKGNTRFLSKGCVCHSSAGLPPKAVREQSHTCCIKLVHRFLPSSRTLAKENGDVPCQHQQSGSTWHDRLLPLCFLFLCRIAKGLNCWVYSQRDKKEHRSNKKNHLDERSWTWTTSNRGQGLGQPPAVEGKKFDWSG